MYLLFGGAAAHKIHRNLRIRPTPPNYPLIYPKYALLRTIRALLKGPWGVLGFGFSVDVDSEGSLPTEERKGKHEHLSELRKCPVLC